MYSEFGEDDLVLASLASLLKGEPGLYVDVGAGHPRFSSNTALLHDHGWRGINIEPQPRLHEFLEKDRPLDVNLNLAVSDHNGDMLLHEYGFGRWGWATIDSATAQRHLMHGHHSTQRRTVPVRTLTRVLASHVVSQDIHFMSIDVEGHELEVLLGLDLAVYRPWVLLIEAVRPGSALTPTDREWEAILHLHGYRFATASPVNRFYVDARRLPPISLKSVNGGERGERGDKES